MVSMAQVQSESVRETLLQGVDHSAPHAASLENEIKLASSLGDMCSAFQGANRITVRDLGSGMSLAILSDAFLTIGTRYRRVEREKAASNSKARATLGDKGVGRLSMMRLGSQMLVRTTQSHEQHWHELRIDWEVFSHDSDLLLGDIPVGPTEGQQKEDHSISGTELQVWGLAHSWTRRQVEDIARVEFARFMDPFASRRSTSIRVAFNSSRVTIPSFDSLLFENAHATLQVAFTPNGSSVNSENTFDFGRHQLQDCQPANELPPRPTRSCKRF